MDDNLIYDIVIVGGGIVGLATAYKLNLRFPQKKILVLEKENEIAYHQTGHNSGVVHSGIYYKPGSYKAKNCIEGRRELIAFAKEHKIPHDICGKIIVATKSTELDYMHKVFQNGKVNGVESIELINSRQIQEIEPYCRGIEGIWIPCTGIIDFATVAKKYREIIECKFPNSKVLTSIEVIDFEKCVDHINVITSKGSYKANYIITCAGLQSDRMAKKEGTETDVTILGFRGDYYNLSEKARIKVKNLIYPVPNPQFPFLGVHFTRMIDGSVECGPNAVFVFKREGYNKIDFSLRDTKEALAFSGTWKFFKKHWRFGLDEYRRAFSKQLFLNRLQQLVPELTMDDISFGRSGVRAMALSKQGTMVDDFKIERNGNMLHVLNAPSPAATASLAIGTEITILAIKQFNLN